MLTLLHQDKRLEISINSMIIIENVTLDQYESFVDEDLKVDYDGKCLYIHSPASYRHEKLVFKVLTLLDQYFTKFPNRGDALGSHFAIHLPNGKRPEPDIVVIPINSVTPTDSTYEGIPLLVVEVLSPATRDHDLTRKLHWFQEAQIPEIWIIDPEQASITLYFLETDQSYRTQQFEANIAESIILPDFTVTLTSLFP